MKVLFICGSRNFSDYMKIRAVIVESKPDLVMTGGGGDADTYAGVEAEALGIHVIEVKALWDFHGKKAGPVRNATMSRILADFQNAGTDIEAVAFLSKPLNDSRGTADMVARLRKVNKIEPRIIT